MADKNSSHALHMKLLNKVAYSERPASEYDIEKVGPLQPGYYVHKWLIRGLQQTEGQKDNQYPLNVPIPETIVNNKNNELSILYYDSISKTLRCKPTPIDSRRDKESFVMDMVEKCVLYPGVSDASIDNIANELVAVRKTPTWGNNSVCNYTELLTPTLLQARLLEVTSQKELNGSAAFKTGKGATDSSNNKIIKNGRKGSRAVSGNVGATKQPAVVQRFIHTKGRQAGFFRVFWVSGNHRDGNTTTVGYKVSRNTNYGYSTVGVKTSIFEGELTPVKKEVPKSKLNTVEMGHGHDQGQGHSQGHMHDSHVPFSRSNSLHMQVLQANSQSPSRQHSRDFGVEGKGHSPHDHRFGHSGHGGSGTVSPVNGHAHNDLLEHSSSHRSGTSTPIWPPASPRNSHSTSPVTIETSTKAKTKTKIKPNSTPHYLMALHPDTHNKAEGAPIEEEVIAPPKEEPVIVDPNKQPELKKSFMNLFLGAMKGKHTLDDIKPLDEDTLALGHRYRNSPSQSFRGASPDPEIDTGVPVKMDADLGAAAVVAPAPIRAPVPTSVVENIRNNSKPSSSNHLVGHYHEPHGATSAESGRRSPLTSNSQGSSTTRRRTVAPMAHSHDHHGWGRKRRRRRRLAGAGSSSSESSTDETDSASESDDGSEHGHRAPMKIRYQDHERNADFEHNKFDFSSHVSYKQYTSNVKEHNYNTVREPIRRADDSGPGQHYSTEEQRRKHQQREYYEEQRRLRETGSPYKNGHRPGGNTYRASMLQKEDTRHDFLDNMHPIVVEAVYQNNITKIYELTKNLGPSALCCLTNNSTSFPVIDDGSQQQTAAVRSHAENDDLQQSPFELALAKTRQAASDPAKSTDAVDGNATAGGAAPVPIAAKLETVKESSKKHPVVGTVTGGAVAVTPANDIFNMNGQRLVITKVSASAVAYAIERIEELAHWLQATIFRLENVHVKFSSMVVDFMKEGGTGQWYMIQVKGFELVPSESFSHRLLLWNYNRMLRVAVDEGEDVEDEYLKGKKGGEIDSDYHVFPSSQATSELLDETGRPASASKLIKNINQARMMNRTLDNSMRSTKETIRRMMNERGSRCQLCGLYFVHDAFISIALGLEKDNEDQQQQQQAHHKTNHDHKFNHGRGHHHHKHVSELGGNGSDSDGSQDSITFLMGNYKEQSSPVKKGATFTSHRHGTGGKSGATAGQESDGNIIDNHNHTTGDHASHGMKMKHVPAYGYFITMNMAYKLLEIYYDIAHHKGKENGTENANASRLAHKTKFAREIFANYTENKSNPSSSWAQHMYEAVTCCYYCHQVIEEYNQYVQVLQKFNRVLGTELVAESVVHGADQGEEFLNHGGTVMMNATVSGPGAGSSKKIKSVAVVGSVDNEIAAAMHIREEFLTSWWKYHRAQPNNRPSMAVSEAAGGTGDSVDMLDNEVDHIKSDDIFSVQALIHQNNSAALQSDGLSALGLTNSRVNHQWRMLIMSHFIADTVNNSILNEIIYNHGKNEHLHNFNNEHMQLYGQLKYLLGQKVTTIEFPLDSKISGTKHGGRSGGKSNAGAVPLKYGETDDVTGTPEDHDTTDPVVWIKQCRLHHVFGSSENCRKYFGNNDIHFFFSIFSYSAPVNTMGVSTHNGLLSSSSNNKLTSSQSSFHSTFQKKSATGKSKAAGTVVDAPVPPHRVNHYQTTFSVSLHELVFTGDCDELHGATEKIDVFIPVSMRGGQTAAAVIAESGEPTPFKSTAGFTEPARGSGENDHPLIFKFSVAVTKCAPLVPPEVAASTAATASAAMSGASTAAATVSPYSNHMTIMSPALVKEEFSMVRSAEHHLSAEIKVKAGSDLGHNMNSSTICLYWPQPSYYDFEILPQSWLSMMTNYGAQHSVGQIFESAAVAPAAHSFAAKSSSKQEAHRLSMHSLDWARKGKAEMLATKTGNASPTAGSPTKSKVRKPTRMNGSASASSIMKSTGSLYNVHRADDAEMNKSLYAAIAETNPEPVANLTGPSYKALLEAYRSSMRSIFLVQKPALAVELGRLNSRSSSRRLSANSSFSSSNSSSAGCTPEKPQLSVIDEPLKKLVNSFIYVNELYKYFRQEMRECLFNVESGDGPGNSGEELAFTSDYTRLKMLMNSHSEQDHTKDIRKEVLDDILTVLDRLISARDDPTATNPTAQSAKKQREIEDEDLFSTTDDAQTPALIPETTNWYDFLALFDQFIARNYELGKAENNILQEDNHIVKVDRVYLRGEDEEAALNDTKYVGMEDSYLNRRLAQEVEVYYKEEEKRSRGKVLEEGDPDHYTLANDFEANEEMLEGGGEVMLASNIKVMASKVDAGVSKIYEAVKAVTTPNVSHLLDKATSVESDTESKNGNGGNGNRGNSVGDSMGEGAGDVVAGSKDSQRVNNSAMSVMDSIRLAVANANALKDRSPFVTSDSFRGPSRGGISAGSDAGSVSDQDTVVSEAPVKARRARAMRHTSCFASHSMSPSAQKKNKLSGVNNKNGSMMPMPKRQNPSRSIIATIRSVFVEGLQSEERRKRRYNIYASIYSLVNSMSSARSGAAEATVDDASIDVRDLRKFLTGEQEKLRRFMLLASDGRILIPPVTTISSNLGQYYEESAVFLGKFSLARSIVCSWLLSCSTKLRQLFRLYAGDESMMGTRAVISQVGFLTAAEECFQRLSTQLLSSPEGAVREYSKTHYDRDSLWAFVTLLHDEKQAYGDYVAAREVEEVQVAFNQGLADRELTKDEDCLLVTMVCSHHGRELFYLHDLCCCQCVAHLGDSRTNTPRHCD